MTDTISTLNNLISTCRDGEHGFRTAAEHLKDGAFRSLFEHFARQRAEIAAELEQLVSRLGGAPASGGSVSGAMHRGWMDLRAALTRGDEQIIAEAERGEDAAKAAFESALSDVREPSVKAAIDRAYQKVREAHDRVRAIENAAAPRE
jgi:uncharacterized protein (TIGR02284 family)